MIINIKQFNLIIHFFMSILCFFIKVQKLHLLEKNVKKIFKKKNLFFKKKFNQKNLFSKRTSILLKKRKKVRFVKKKKKINNGNFFFKKFFFKTLLQNRKFLKGFFYLNGWTRQSKLTQFVFNSNKTNTNKNITQHNNIVNILLRSHFFFFINDASSAVRSGFILLNGLTIFNTNTPIKEGDCLQSTISKGYLKYLYFCKKFFKKKSAIFRFNSWKFFKTKFFKKSVVKNKKKYPKFLPLFFLFKMNVYRFLEVDFVTLTIFFLKKVNDYRLFTYYLDKVFSFKLFSLYNFKKIN